MTYTSLRGRCTQCAFRAALRALDYGSDAYLPTAGFREIVQPITRRFGGGPRAKFAISANTRAPLEQHRRVEGRHERGSVIVRMAAT